MRKKKLNFNIEPGTEIDNSKFNEESNIRININFLYKKINSFNLMLSGLQVTVKSA